MNKAMYKILKRISQNCKHEIAGVYFDFVEDEKVDINNNYIVYSLETNKPRYEYEYSKSVYQVAVYSKDLTTALEIQKDIGKYFSSLKEKIDNIEICGCDIDSETHTKNEADGFYQAISIINILYKY